MLESNSVGSNAGSGANFPETLGARIIISDTELPCL